MNITYEKAKIEDIEPIYELCKQLILDYEDLEKIDVSKVLDWVREKIESSIEQYTVIYADDRKAGYYHFYKNEDGQYEIDDLYIFSEFQNKGLGSKLIAKCCQSVNEPIMLYVFIKNNRAVTKHLSFRRGSMNPER